MKKRSGNKIPCSQKKSTFHQDIFEYIKEDITVENYENIYSVIIDDVTEIAFWKRGDDSIIYKKVMAMQLIVLRLKTNYTFFLVLWKTIDIPEERRWIVHYSTKTTATAR